MRNLGFIPAAIILISCALPQKESLVTRRPASADKCRDSLLGLIDSQKGQGVSEGQIRAAMAAEKLPPTIEVTVRGSGSLDQYSALDRPELVGKKIKVNFIDDRYSPGSNTALYPVSQLVLTREYLDTVSRNLIETIKMESLNGPQKFREVGGWIFYTRNGTYRSRTFTSNDAYGIQNRPVLDSFESALAEAQRAEGMHVKFVDVELFHTHYERGEAFSFGDLDFQRSNFHRFKKHIEPGGAFSSYAVPVQGNVLFKSTVHNNQ